jgi:hypothetical protein
MPIRLLCALVVAATSCLTIRLAIACDFCSATSPTICEELAPAEVVVVARLISFERPRQKVSTDEGVTGLARFEIVEVLRGTKSLKGIKRIEVLDAAPDKPGTLRLFTGCGAPQLTWSQSYQLTERSRQYVRRAVGLPASGPGRLAFFLDYLEDREELIAQDAYNEFAVAPYDRVKELRKKLDRQRLVERLTDPKTPASRRGLLFTLLGICGSREDVAFLEDLLRRGSKENSGCFDALLAAYLSLRGERALELFDDLFLRMDESREQQPEPADSHAAIRALRFHLEGQRGAPKERILASLRLLLARPSLATAVIGDLARWEDWQALPRLVELFQESDAKASDLRVQVAGYLLACPLPEAKTRLDELSKLAPKEVSRARVMAMYGQPGR